MLAESIPSPLQLRTKAIDAGNALLEVIAGMQKHGFTEVEAQRWLTWCILPGNLMEQARESAHDRAEAGWKIERTFTFGA